MTPFLYLTAVILVTFLTRFGVRLLFVPEIMSSDTYAHLTMIKWIRRNRTTWKDTFSAIWPGYPKAFHYVISWVPARFTNLWERSNGALWDSLHVILFVSMLPAIGIDLTESVEFFWLPLLLALAPAWLAVGLGPRGYRATERPFGELLASATFCSLFVAYTHNIWAMWLLAAILGGGVLNASKFGAQVLLGFSWIIAAVTFRVELFFFPLICILIAIAISHGGYTTVLREQIRHLRWYTQAIKERSIVTSERNSIRLFLRRFNENGWIGIGRYFLLENSISIAAMRHGIVWTTIFVMMQTNDITFPNKEFVFAWWAAGFVLFCVTSTRRFLQFGEAERYLLHSVLPEYFILTALLGVSHGQSSITIVLFFSIAWWCIQILLLRYLGSLLNDADDMQEINNVIEHMSQLPQETFCAIGSTFFQFKMAYETAHLHFLMAPHLTEKHTWEDLFLRYPIPRYSVFKSIGIGLLVVDKDFLKNQSNCDIPTDDLPIEYDSRGYCIYRTRIPCQRTVMDAKFANECALMRPQNDST